MLFVKIAWFVILLNLSAGLIGVLGIPMQCDGGNCKTFSTSGFLEVGYYDELQESVDDGSYRDGQVMLDVDSPIEMFNAMTHSLANMALIATYVLQGGANMSSYFLCQGNDCSTIEGSYGEFARTFCLAVVVLTYFSYVLALAQILRGMRIDQ